MYECHPKRRTDITLSWKTGGGLLAVVFVFAVLLVKPTPGSIEVPKSRKDLTVRCEKEGYLATEGTIKSDFQAMTLGNVIFGGLIGVTADTGTGAMNKYEDTVTLIPDTFSSVGEKDAFFDKLRDDLLAEHDAKATEIKNRCQDESACEAKLKKMAKERDRRLADFERLRGEAKGEAVDHVAEVLEQVLELPEPALRRAHRRPPVLRSVAERGVAHHRKGRPRRAGGFRHRLVEARLLGPGFRDPGPALLRNGAATAIPAGRILL
jgi:hypothetical protein